MKKSCKRTCASTFMAILILASIRGVAGAQAEEWIRIQNASQGYALYCPASAVVLRYDPEKVLRIELPNWQFATIRVFDNSARLSALSWTNAQVARGTVEDIEAVGPPTIVVSRDQTMIGSQLAERLLLSSSGRISRRTIIAEAKRVYQIDYPIDDIGSESPFDRIVATFQTGEFAGDEGFMVVEPESVQSLLSLPVPSYSQNNSLWKCDQLGTCTCNFGSCSGVIYTTIGDGGCHITSMAMIFDYFAGSFKNPKELNTCLRVNGQYGTAVGFCVAGYCGIDHPSSPCIPSGVTFEGRLSDKTVLDQDLANGFPVIGRRHDDGHSVAVIGKNGSNYQVIDPWDGASKEVSPSWILYFWRYHGPVHGGCCGCLPASCCSARAAQTSAFPTEIAWASLSISNSAAAPVCTASGTCTTTVSEISADSSDLEPLELGPPEDSVDRGDDLDRLPETPILEPSEVASEPAGSTYAPVPARITVQAKSVEAQRTPPTSASYQLAPSVIATGGGLKTSTSYQVRSTSGQATGVGWLHGATYQVYSGFWGPFLDQSPTLPLNAPSNLIATALSEARISLNWQDNSPDETAFHIERSPNGSTGWALLVTVGANVTNYTDGGLACGTTYYYRVRAYRASDSRYSAYSNVANPTTQPCVFDTHIYLPLVLRNH